MQRRLNSRRFFMVPARSIMVVTLVERSCFFNRKIHKNIEAVELGGIKMTGDMETITIVGEIGVALITVLGNILVYCLQKNTNLKRNYTM
ncbi:hypothetical protein ACI7RC_18295 [Brevibacillus sp. B_LB10_24]|uniref:hypothetical protein n=1 Tax=Brevibacillus sp. B_LB10_24 TaxID=3380645 RepID=UPI0038BC06B0